MIKDGAGKRSPKGERERWYTLFVDPRSPGMASSAAQERKTNLAVGIPLRDATWKKFTI